MTQFLFAAAEAGANGNILSSLGIDWKLFVSQALAFAILLALLSKYVYPVLVKSIDERRAAIEAGLAEAKQAQAASADAEKRVEAMLADARKEADEIVARSHAEGQSMIADAEAKAKQRAERLVADARSQLEAEVSKARTALKKDTMRLVVLATEKVIDQKLDATRDASLVESALAKERA